MRARNGSNDQASRPIPGPADSLISLIAGVALPLAVFYGLSALGVNSVGSSLAGGAVSGVWALYRLVRQRRLDRLAFFTLSLLVVNAGLSVPTILGIIRPSAHVVLALRQHAALFGLWVLLSLMRGKPITVEFSRPFVERRAGPGALDARWNSDPLFRRAYRLVTVVWGGALLGDQLVDVVLAFRLPVDAVPGVQAVQYLALLGLLAGFQWIYLRWKGQLVRPMGVAT